MKFRTELDPKRILDLGMNTTFYSIGSCFANMVGNKLRTNKFKITSNPFGIIYNPLSIFELLNPSSDYLSYMIENDGIWYNYKFHSDYRSSNKDKLRQQILESTNRSLESLEKADVIIITFGTAFVYKLLENNEVVANCHKVAQKNFVKELLSVENIIEAFEGSEIGNKNVNIILTVSPVRHIKDTIELNSVSKSTLRLASYKLQEKYSNVHYYPSYELMMDDLRDYRFYKDDLLHPTEFAENYIWDNFKESIFNRESLNFMSEWDKLTSALNHKPFNPKSEQHQSFLRKQLTKLYELNKLVDCTEEIDLIKNQIIEI